MLLTLKSLYFNVKYCVCINGDKSDFFDVKCGLCQCSLFPLVLFYLFINDLAITIKQLGLGVHIDCYTVAILLYADDICFIAENERDLQRVFDTLNDWCKKWQMKINIKTKIVHFRTPSVNKSKYVFTCGNNNIEMTNM